MYRQMQYDLGKESGVILIGNLKNESHDEGSKKIKCAANIIFEEDVVKKLMKCTQTQSWKSKPLKHEWLYENNGLCHDDITEHLRHNSIKINVQAGKRRQKAVKSLTL